MGLRTLTIHGTRLNPHEKPEWNTNEARLEAAKNLLSEARKGMKEGEKLNVVGFSHGGNVAILASELGLKIDNLVTIGTPRRSECKGNYGNISKHTQVYSPFDNVQILGGNLSTRTFPHAKNVQVNVNQGPIDTHSYLRSPGAWNKYIRKEVES